MSASLEDHIQCVRNEVFRRIDLFRALVATRWMAQRDADWEIDTMKDVLATLESLRDRLPPTHQQEPFGESTS
jgi:hypothetical protein